MINTLSEQGVDCLQTQVEDALIILNPAVLMKSDAFYDGLFHVQDLASQICVKYAGIAPDTIVLDMCSAPGGKAFTASQYMCGKGTLLAFDLHEKRVKLIKEGAERLGIDIIDANVGDATVFNENLPLADTVLCDVVCSGLGVIRRKPETKYKNPDDLKRLPTIQLKILTTASQYVKVGGNIVYSTCTVNKDENERVVEEFLKNNPNFDYAYPDEKCITLFGNDNNSDGFFMCKLKRLR